MYVEDGKRTYRHTFIKPFLIWYHLNVILCMSKMCILEHVEDVEDNLRHLRHASTYIGFDGMVGKLSLSFPKLFSD